MKLSQFKFKLPEELIAQYPSENRDECRLMVVNTRTGEISHHIFKDIINFFDEGDVLVFNDTKGFPGPSFRQQGEDRGTDRGIPAARAQCRA